MKCLICNQGETLPGTTSVLLERDELRLTIEHVPAQLCPLCGEAYADETVATTLLREAEARVMAGIKVDTCEYASLAG